MTVRGRRGAVLFLAVPSLRRFISILQAWRSAVSARRRVFKDTRSSARRRAASDRRPSPFRDLLVRPSSSSLVLCAGILLLLLASRYRRTTGAASLPATAMSTADENMGSTAVGHGSG
jgi:hypothetical protein